MYTVYVYRSQTTNDGLILISKNDLYFWHQTNNYVNTNHIRLEGAIFLNAIKSILFYVEN